MKAKSTLAAILSTTAIASGVLLASASSTEACKLTQERYQQASWLQSPWALVITLPGIALAAALSLGGKAYQE